MKRRGGSRVNEVLEEDEVNAVLRETFYSGSKKKRAPAKAKAKKSKKADHYDVICISLYKEDLARLDAMVTKLKKRGHRRVSRSALIRFALDQVDPKDFPRAY
ncbi:MAG: hypothetical protein AAF500_13965 [Myxococcota bacterium]